jgi:hypothetical protein
MERGGCGHERLLLRLPRRGQRQGKNHEKARQTEGEDAARPEF